MYCSLKVILFPFHPPACWIGRSPRKPAPRPTSWRASHKTWAPCGPTSATAAEVWEGSNRINTHTHIYIYILWIYHDQDHLHQYTVDVPNIDSNLEYIEHCISWFLCPIDMYWQPGRLVKRLITRWNAHLHHLASSGLISLLFAFHMVFLEPCIHLSIYLSILF